MPRRASTPAIKNSGVISKSGIHDDLYLGALYFNTARAEAHETCGSAVRSFVLPWRFRRLGGMQRPEDDLRSGASSPHRRAE